MIVWIKNPNHHHKQIVNLKLVIPPCISTIHDAIPVFYNLPLICTDNMTQKRYACFLCWNLLQVGKWDKYGSCIVLPMRPDSRNSGLKLWLANFSFWRTQSFVWFCWTLSLFLINLLLRKSNKVEFSQPSLTSSEMEASINTAKNLGLEVRHLYSILLMCTWSGW
jgi:hypothetical protein